MKRGDRQKGQRGDNMTKNYRSFTTKKAAAFIAIILVVGSGVSRSSHAFSIAPHKKTCFVSTTKRGTISTALFSTTEEKKGTTTTSLKEDIQTNFKHVEGDDTSATVSSPSVTTTATDLPPAEELTAALDVKLMEKKMEDTLLKQSTASVEAKILKDEDTGKVSVAVEEVNGEAVPVKDGTSTSVVGEVELKANVMEEAEPLLVELEAAAQAAVDDLVDDTCEVDVTTGEPIDMEICADENALKENKSRLKSLIGKTIRLVRGTSKEEDDETDTSSSSLSNDDIADGDVTEQGWEMRGGRSSFRRNAEVWKFALKCVFKVLASRKLTLEDDIKKSQTEAATFIRDGLVTLGPTFVKLGQVISTRTDVLPETYTEVLKTLQDDVPAFSGQKAKEIVTRELGKPCDEIFENFSPKPLKAASLGQVHTAYYKGQKVAIKVQRAGLKELFDVDLKNLKKLAELLDKFDPKSDGADRDWVKIYEESERLLYEEINYINEADNADRFRQDFKDIPWVRIPKFYREVTTPRVLTMEFVDSFKLTDIPQIEKLGLNRDVLAKRVADAFLRQIVETGYFHADPHPGNMCVDTKGNLVFYDFGMMDEQKPNVRRGFKKFCTALFKGGPTIDDTQLAINAKLLVDGVEEAGVLAKGADRLAVEKLARYFMRTFKNNQLGKSSKNKNIKQAVGTDLQTLTENNVFKFPSTFTFIFRSFASVDGIGKGLSKNFDIGKLSQPFVEQFIDDQKGYTSQADKSFDIFKKATGLNKKDISTAVMSPKKIAYIEDTIRNMEEGNLKIRVRSLENEKALERMALTQTRMENLLLTSVLLTCYNVIPQTKTIVRTAALAASAYAAFQTLMSNVKIKKFDKTQAKFVSTSFEGEGDSDDDTLSDEEVTDEIFN